MQSLPFFIRSSGETSSFAIEIFPASGKYLCRSRILFLTVILFVLYSITMEV